MGKKRSARAAFPFFGHPVTPADPGRIAAEMSARCGSGAPVAVRLLDVGFDDGGFVGAVREPPHSHQAKDFEPLRVGMYWDFSFWYSCDIRFGDRLE